MRAQYPEGSGPVRGPHSGAGLAVPSLSSLTTDSWQEQDLTVNKLYYHQ